MPDMNGEEVFEKLRDFDGDVKVLFVSGYVHSELRNRLLASGAAGFRAKPFLITDLLGDIRKILG